MGGQGNRYITYPGQIAHHLVDDTATLLNQIQVCCASLTFDHS